MLQNSCVEDLRLQSPKRNRSDQRKRQKKHFDLNENKSNTSQMSQASVETHWYKI